MIDDRWCIQKSVIAGTYKTKPVIVGTYKIWWKSSERTQKKGKFRGKVLAFSIVQC